MVKFFDNAYSYEYSLPTVSLAYFIRYPNPHATHVISTDVIERHVDPATERLHTTRLVKKQSRLPPAVMALLPKNILGGGNNTGGPNGEAQNFILETSIVDVHEGWMTTETQNLQYRGVLSVIERQRYERPKRLRELQMAQKAGVSVMGLVEASQDTSTDVVTKVTFKSRFGLRRREAAAAAAAAAAASASSSSSTASTTATAEEDGEEKKGFLASWSTSAFQRTIESTSLNRTMKGLVKSREGMNIVMERIREGGLVGALEGMRRDRELSGRGSASNE